MTNFEKKKLQFEFARFAKMNFEKPCNCKDVQQVGYYIQELSAKIEELQDQWGYVPDMAYTLLDQYNQLHRKMVYAGFINSY